MQDDDDDDDDRFRSSLLSLITNLRGGEGRGGDDDDDGHAAVARGERQQQQRQRRRRRRRLQVVNAGQNMICTWTIVNDRIDRILAACDPDYVFVLVGTNDARGVYRPLTWGNESVWTWRLPHRPSHSGYRQDLDALVNKLVSSTRAYVAVCTLPPLGENLDHPANDVVRKMNDVVRDVVRSHTKPASSSPSSSSRSRVSIIELYDALAKAVIDERWRRRALRLRTRPPQNVDNFILTSIWMTFLYYALDFPWIAMSKWVGNVVRLHFFLCGWMVSLIFSLGFATHVARRMEENFTFRHIFYFAVPNECGVPPPKTKTNKNKIDSLSSLPLRVQTVKSLFPVSFPFPSSPW